jgi:hypothetical protein
MCSAGRTRGDELDEAVDGYVKSCSVIFRSREGGDNISRQCDVGVSDE